MENSIKLLLTSIKYIGIKESLTGWDEQIKKWIYASCDSIGLARPTDDATFPWCACFISNMLIESGIWPNDHKHIVAARKFLNPEQIIPIEDLRVGDVVILERGGGKGHIGIFLNSIDGKLNLLSGNCNNSVTLSFYDPKRYLGAVRF